MHLVSRPSPSFKTQFKAAADGSEREYPIPIARNIACVTIRNHNLPHKQEIQVKESNILTQHPSCPCSHYH